MELRPPLMKLLIIGLFLALFIIVAESQLQNQQQQQQQPQQPQTPQQSQQSQAGQVPNNPIIRQPPPPLTTPPPPLTPPPPPSPVPPPPSPQVSSPPPPVSPPPPSPPPPTPSPPPPPPSPMLSPPPRHSAPTRSHPERKSNSEANTLRSRRKQNGNLNTGKKVGLLFAGIAVILQIGVVSFLAFKRRQLYKMQRD